MRNILTLPNGTEIASGTVGQNALRSVSVTECVNSGTELTLGSTCSNMLEASIFAPNALQINAGDEIILHRENDDKSREQIGIFITEKPTKSSAYMYKITAYDRVSKLDKDITDWMESSDAWPYTLFDFAEMVCKECGVVLSNESLPNGDFPIYKFSASGITGRQILSWVGEACAMFCRATPDGKIEFAWYAESPVSVGVTAGEGQCYYYQGSFSKEDYTVSPIAKVQIKFSDNDVGVIWPNDPNPANTYKIIGNYLLLTDTTDRLLPIAQHIYEAVKGIKYTPCKVSIQAGYGIHAGHILQIQDIKGNSISTYIMKAKQTGNRVALESTGSPKRDSVTAVNNRHYEALYGKCLDLETSVEGLFVKAADAEGNIAKLATTTQGLSSTVEKQSQDQEVIKQEISAIKQTAGDVSIKIQSILQNGVDKVVTTTGYRFDGDGMHVAKEGDEIENRVDNTGTYVTRSGATMFKANNLGVTTADLTCRNYLKIAHSRFEGFGAGGTACFWMQFASGENILLDSHRTFQNNDFQISAYTPSSPLVQGETYTFSLCVTPAPGTTHYTVHLSNGYRNNAILPVDGTKKQIIRVTFQAAYEPGKTPSDDPNFAIIRNYRFPNDGSVVGEGIVEWAKLEVGDSATDWSPSPEE